MVLGGPKKKKAITFSRNDEGALRFVRKPAYDQVLLYGSKRETGGCSTPFDEYKVQRGQESTVYRRRLTTVALLRRLR